MVRWVYVIGFMCCLIGNSVQAQQSSPEIVNQIATIKSIDSESKDRFANPSEPGIPAGDLNGDGELDFIQNWETWRDMRGFTNDFKTVTTFLSYNQNAEATKVSFVEGTYLPVGDLDNDGFTEIASINENGYVVIHSVSSNDEEDFVVLENGREVVSEQRYYSLSYTMPAFLDDDELPDALLCENEFNSFNECMIIFGKGDEATPLTFTEFSFSGLGINFFAAPQLFIGASISGNGLGIYAMGETSPNFQSMMYELGFDENNDVELAFSDEWLLASGELLPDRRFFIEDFDGDGELEILSSDDREFALAGFQRIYFTTPTCDIRDVDYSGDTPVLQTPDIISNNCLVDRVVQPDTTQNAAKSVFNKQNENDEPLVWIWKEGNYSSCTASDLYQGCSSQTTVITDQTTYPCTYNSCGSPYYYYPYSSYPYYYNGYANPRTATRGLQVYTISNRTQLTPVWRSNTPEIQRIMEINYINGIRARLNSNQTVTQRELDLLARAGHGYYESGYSCSSSSSSCSEYTQTNGNYYRSVNQYNAIESVNRYVNQTGVYRHYQVATPIQSNSSNPRFLITFHESSLEGDENPKRIKSNDLQVVTDSVESSGTINTEILGELDSNSSPYTVKNLGDIDGIPGEELFIGTNFARNNSNPINRGWIYLGTNTTYQEPDVTIDFRNDSTINEFTFLQVGGVVENLGDVNGDGINDFGIGLVDYKRESNSSGGVYVFAGRDFSESGDTLRTPIAILEPNPLEGQTTFAFGAQISGGDFDGDGFNDVAVLTDQGTGSPTLPTITIFKGGEEMDTEPDYFLYVTPNDVGSFGSDTLSSFFGAIIEFMPKNEGENYQDLYFTPGGFSNYPDAVIFQGTDGTPSTTPAFTLAEAGATPTGTGVFLRTKPAVGDFNQDGFYDVAITKQFDGRDALVSSRVLIFSPHSEIQVASEIELENPLEYRLSQNYPNPFNPSTTIEFRLGESSIVTLKVFDVLGREVATLVNNQKLSAGVQNVQFDATSLASGVYIYRLEAGGFSQTRKMMLVK